jgi:hypothetical protein
MRFFAIVCTVMALLSFSSAKDEFQADDFVKQHLNSIGADQARAAVKSRAVSGTVSFQVLNGGSGRQDGKQQLFSDGDKFVSMLKLPNSGYHGELFVSDGKKTSISQVKPGVYSNLGQFIFSHPEILTEGLWGGALSTAWALNHLGERNAKLKDQGLKKMESGTLHRVDYIPRKHSDLEIQLYFEPETLRHVLTVYSLLVDARMSASEVANSQQQQSRYRLEERFADFKNIDNLILPQKWTIQFSVQLPQGGSRDRSDINVFDVGPANSTISAGVPRESNTPVTRFEVVETDISHNVTIDSKNFEIK